jgi:hypothetical protein
MTHNFAAWSGDFKSYRLQACPESLIFWYAAFVFAASLLRFAGGQWRNTAVVPLDVGVLGIQEFAVATLADTAETARHLFFHVCTDVKILFAVGASLGSLSRKLGPLIREFSSASFRTGR